MAMDSDTYTARGLLMLSLRPRPILTTTDTLDICIRDVGMMHALLASTQRQMSE